MTISRSAPLAPRRTDTLAINATYTHGYALSTGLRILDYSKDLYLVQHEDLLEEDRLEDIITKIVQFLKFDVDTERIGCILRHGKGMSNHHRYSNSKLKLQCATKG